MEMTIRELLETIYINYPHREAFVFKDGRATYAEYYAKVNQKANALLEIGIKKGDHVGLPYLVSLTKLTDRKFAPQLSHNQVKNQPQVRLLDLWQKILQALKNQKKSIFLMHFPKIQSEKYYEKN